MAERPSDMDRELQAEVDAALGDMSLEDLVASSPSRPAPAHGGEAPPRRPRLEPGARIHGVIIRVGREDVFVDLGPKLQGVCPLMQFEENPSVGANIEFIVNRVDRREGLVLLGRAGTVQKGEWDTLQKGQTIEAQCTGVNKGGLEIQVGSVRAFMPAGQVDRSHIDDLSTFVGQSLTCEVMDINREKRNLVLSRKAVQEREAAIQREKTMETLAVGQELDGVVRRLMPFGAFVDLGGVDGLVHISDLSYERVNKPEDVVHEGQTVRVKVLRIDEGGHKISLGMKQCQADPFLTAGATLAPGSEVVGKVVRLADFGAFVQIAPGVDGLIHISELSHERVNRVTQVVKMDEIVRVKVLDVDPSSHRISLSLKAMKSKEDEEAPRGDDNAMSRLRAKWGSDKSLKGGLG